MEQCKIARISELSKKSKRENLTDEEKNEQNSLRQEYLSDMKKSFKATLDNVVIVDTDGNRSCLKNKDQ